jgi:hypothetical protein
MAFPQDYLIQNTALTDGCSISPKQRKWRFVLVRPSRFSWPKNCPSAMKPVFTGRSHGKQGSMRRGPRVRHPYAIVRPSITYGPGDTME